jgi:hypothetical protein
MRDPNEEPRRRDEMAWRAAPYCHARKVGADVKVNEGLSLELMANSADRDGSGGCAILPSAACDQTRATARQEGGKESGRRCRRCQKTLILQSRLVVQERG